MSVSQTFPPSGYGGINIELGTPILTQYSKCPGERERALLQQRETTDDVVASGHLLFSKLTNIKVHCMSAASSVGCARLATEPTKETEMAERGSVVHTVELLGCKPLL